jgi:hypothetical protein
MKTSTWVLLGVGAVAIYLYFTQIANKFTWLLQNVSISAGGLIATINLKMLVTSGSSVAATVSNMVVNIIYNNNTIGTAVSQPFTINPGSNSITFPVNLSDLTILTDIASAAQNPGTTISIVIKGSGTIDGVPASFSQNYNFTT